VLAEVLAFTEVDLAGGDLAGGDLARGVVARE
jgi:hypothetical protein